MQTCSRMEAGQAAHLQLWRLEQGSTRRGGNVRLRPVSGRLPAGAVRWDERLPRAIVMVRGWACKHSQLFKLQLRTSQAEAHSRTCAYQASCQRQAA